MLMKEYVQNSNLIPSIKTTGKFKATAPFDSVFDPNTTYQVVGIRSIEELEANKVDIYQLVLQKVGVAKEDAPALIKKCKALDGVIVIFGVQGQADIYVPSTFLPSLPDTGGVEYERLCLIVDLGAVPIHLKERINTAKAHINDYVTSHIGVTNSVSFGSLPTSQFVSQEQANIFESTRQNKINTTKTDAMIIKELNDKVAKLEAYNNKLEEALKAHVPK